MSRYKLKWELLFEHMHYVDELERKHAHALAIYLELLTYRRLPIGVSFLRRYKRTPIVTRTCRHFLFDFMKVEYLGTVKQAFIVILTLIL